MSKAIETPVRSTAASGPSASRLAPARDPFGALGDLGSAVVIALAVLIPLVMLLGRVGLRPLSPGLPGTLTLAGGLGCAVLAYVWLGWARPRSAPLRFWTAVVPAAPALVLAGYAMVACFLPVGVRAEWFLNGDHVRHTIMVAEEQATGTLSYATWAYPRGWHTLVAALWSTAGAEPGSDFAGVVVLSSVAVWCLSVFFALSTAMLAATLADRYGMGLRSAAFSGVVAGLLTFLSWFLGSYQALGFETSLLGATTLAVVLRSQLTRPFGLRALVIAAAGLVVLAHTWQLLMPVVAVAALRSGLGLWRRRGASGLAVAAVLAVAASLAAWPALRVLVTVVGIQHATDAGVDVPTPWLLLVLGVIAAALLYRELAAQERWVLLLMVVPALTGLSLAVSLGISPATYYPAKLMWHTASLLLAPLAVLAVAGARRVAREGSPGARVARVIGGPAVVLGGLYLLVQPAGAFVGVWSTVDGSTLLRVVQAPNAARAQVVWSGAGLGTDTLARSFLDAVRPSPGPLTTPQEALDVEEECALLAAADTPGVLTAMPAAQARERYACVQSLDIIEVR